MEIGYVMKRTFLLDEGRYIFLLIAILCVFLSCNISSGREIPSLQYDDTAANRFAVVIGISRYKNHDLDLRFADKDAISFYEFLRSSYGGAFPEKNIVLLLNEQATSSKVRWALGTFLPSRAHESDLVIIYFAGHGDHSPYSRKDLYFLTYDAEPNNLASTSIPMDEISIYLRRSIKAKNVVVIVDACHSGEIKLMGSNPLKINGKIINKYLKAISDVRPGFVSISATTTSRFSEEGYQYGGGHGVFTYYLLKGLTDDAPLVDTNEDGIVTVGEIYEYVRQNVKKATRGRQIPDKEGDLDIGIPLSVVEEKSSLQKNISLLVKVIAHNIREKRTLEIRSGVTLHSGDGYYIKVIPEQKCYLYIYQVDALNRVYRLFPNASFSKVHNPLNPFKKIELPSPNTEYFLDNSTGMERIYLFASSCPIEDIDGLKSELINGTGSIINKMGVAGVRDRQDIRTEMGPASLSLESSLGREVFGKGHFYYEVWFYHR